MRVTRPTAGLGALAAAAALALLPLGASLPAAHAAAGVRVDADGRGAIIDSSYSTRLRVSGSGFQSVKGGHGGVYVWFGTVSGRWQPSRGGRSGVDYFYVPDAEAKDNQGFQQFVSFPGSATSGSSGAQMSTGGSFSVTLTVPGPTFEAVGRNGAVRTVDCRRTTCGVITVGAHGVRNANNETFTPVRVADLHGSAGSGTGDGSGSSGTTEQPADGRAQPATAPGAASAQPGGAAPAAPRVVRPRGPVRLEVDRPSAVAGRALAWSAANLTPGRQFSVVLDDGAVASGPHAAGTDGRVSGVITLPASLGAGTHELRLFGAGRDASIRFGVAVGDDAAPAADPDAAPVAGRSAEGPEPAEWLGWGFASLGAVVLALAVVVRRRPGTARA